MEHIPSRTGKGLCFSTLLTLILIFGVYSQGFGWGGENHRVITANTVASLPQWEQEILGVFADSLIQQYCLIPDFYGGAAYKIAYAPYIEIPFLPATKLYHMSEDQLADVYIFTYFSEKAIQYLRDNNIHEAAKYLGTLAHFIEDNACPVHVIDNQLLAKLLPAPPSIENFRVHAVENPVMSLRITGYDPKRIGGSIFESVEPFVTRFLAMRENSLAQSVPVVQGVYENNPMKSDISRIRAAEPSVKLLADVLHTIFCIAYNK